MSAPPLPPALIGRNAQRATNLSLLLGLIVVLGGVVHAYLLRWLCDDIFITLRYIDQWFAGNGLVYNPGERVEGYTHPLWLLLLSGWRLLGFEVTVGSQTFGLVSQGLLLTTLAYASWRLAGKASHVVPAAAMAVAIHHDASVWATSGLETALFTCLVTASVVVLIGHGLRERTRLFLSGTALVLATLTRPDGLLFLVTMGGIVVIRAWSLKKEWKDLRHEVTAFLLPSAVFIPYALWKLAYYGNLLPNTYYAKSGGGFHISQGLTYVSTYLSAYPSTYVLLLVPVVLFVLFRRSGTFRGFLSNVFAEHRLTVSLICGLMSVTYILFFVIRVGGDFMFARFIVPTVPLLYLAAEAVFRVLAENRKRLMLAGLMLIPLLVSTADVWSRDRLFVTNEEGQRMLRGENSGIIDEHWFWTKPFTQDGQNAIVMLRGIGETLQTYFDCLTVRILIRGQACLAYYSKATEVIENWGLTDAFIARQEMEGRGRVGHEKAAPMDYIVARRVHFFFFDRFTPSDTSHYRIVTFELPYGWGSAEMHFYDRELMRTLRERFPDQISFVDFEAYLDDYLLNSDRKSRRQLETDFAAFRSYYFMHNADPEREKQFIERMVKKGRQGR